jgi:hypothetical protein
MTYDPDPHDVVTRLVVLGRAAEISISGLDKKAVAAIALEAASLIREQRRIIRALEVETEELRAGAHSSA